MAKVEAEGPYACDPLIVDLALRLFAAMIVELLLLAAWLLIAAICAGFIY